MSKILFKLLQNLAKMKKRQFYCFRKPDRHSEITFYGFQLLYYFERTLLKLGKDHLFEEFLCYQISTVRTVQPNMTRRGSHGIATAGEATPQGVTSQLPVPLATDTNAPVIPKRTKRGLCKKSASAKPSEAAPGAQLGSCA